MNSLTPFERAHVEAVLNADSGVDAPLQSLADVMRHLGWSEATANPNLQRLPVMAGGEPVIGVDMAKPGTDRMAVMRVPGGGFVVLLHSEVTRAELMGQAGTN